MKAQKVRTASALKSAAKQKFTSNVTLGDLTAEAFSGATRISWHTTFEENTLGFRVWREDKGEKALVNEDLVAGGLLKVGNGVLPAGGAYSAYDLNGSSETAYWLEALDVNGASRWFGPVFPQMNFDLSEAETQAEVIANLKNARGGRGGLRETVDFAETVLEKEFVESAAAVEADLMTDDPNALKIEVRSRGLYRVDAQTLAANGFNAAQSAYWKLFAGSVEQPMVVNADGSIEFFGQGVDTIQTDANVYWLVRDASTGKRIKRVSQKYLNSARNSSFRVTVEKREKAIRVSSVINGARENWYDTVVSPTASHQTLMLTDISAENNQTATIGVDLQGLTAIPHAVSVMLNGVSIGQINFNYLDRVEWATSVPVSRLVEGANTITLQSLGGSQDINITEAVRISYPRELAAQNNRLDFSVSSGKTVKLSGFTSPQVRILDVTNPTQINELAPQSRLESDGTYSVTINSASNNRLMLATTAAMQPLAPASVTRNKASNLRSTANQAKFLVVAPNEFVELLQSFVAARNAGGMQTQLVDVEDIYDEFNGGVKSAEAIRSFLQHAKQNWSVKPDFVMFVGDASVDPRNYTGAGGYEYNRVPTILVDTWNMETVSDEAMADFNNDGVGELATGRLPAKDATQLTAMLEKISNTRPLTRSEISQRGVHFISDAFFDYNFPGGSRNMATYFPATVTVNYLDAAGQDTATLRSAIINRINTGPAIVNYFGHASVVAWANSQMFRSYDVPSLTNSNAAPFMTMINCLNGDYAETNLTGLAEAAMKQRYGGASAVWASSGYNGAYEQEFYTRDFYQKAFTGMPLGEAARQTKMLYTSLDLRRTYVFFGDPTQPLVTQ